MCLSRSAVIFINPCPEICILKAGKFPLLNLRGSIVGSNFQCLFLGSRPGSKQMRYSSPSSAKGAAQVENLRHSKGSVWQFSPQLQSRRSLCLSSLQLFAEINYLASRQLWNLQTLIAPDTNFPWVVPSTRFKFGNPDLQCTIHRNRLQDINQQFLKFRFSKGTNVELKEAVKHFTTEYRSGGVLMVDKLRLGKKLSWQGLC